MSQKIVDARGLSCPEPALLTRQAIEKIKSGSLEVLVDSATARDNVTRLARNNGWQVTLEEKPDDSYRLVLKK